MSRLFYHVMQDNAGNLLFDVSGTMRVAGSGTLATIYGDEELTVVLPNPMTNHPSFGSFKCFLGAGAYDFYMAKSGYTFETLTGVQGHGTMALQNANAVTIGGHANTGVLDVQGSVARSDGINTYVSARLWPVAPSSATLVQAIRIEAPTGAGLSTTNFQGIAMGGDPPAGLSAVTGLALGVSAGVNRYNLQSYGTAQNYFAGNVGIANAAPSYPLDVTGNVRLSGKVGIQGPNGTNMNLVIWHDKTNTTGIQLQPTVSDTGAAEIAFANIAGGMVGTIVTTATATTYNSASDVRLKRNIQALLGGGEVIQRLHPVSFRWNADDSPGTGFLAHELMHVVPEAVTGEPDAVNDDGSVRPQQVDHSRLVPWLTAALQEAVAQIQGLTARVANLEQQLVVS